MGYKVEHEDEHTFTIKHPDGSHFAVAKHLLDKPTLERISALKPQKMADGGEVEDIEDDGATEEAAPSTPEESVPVNIGGAGDYGQQATTAEGMLPQQPGTIAPGVDGIKTTGPSMANGMPYAGQATDMENIYKKQAGAIQQGAQAQSEAQKTQEGLYAQQAKQLEDIRAKSEQAYNEFHAEDQRLTKEYSEGKLNPNNVWQSMGTGNKIGAGIAILLGGIGAGMTGKSNMAMDVMNKAIDRDIEAQKFNIGKTANLMTMNMRRYQNEEQARAATKLEMLAATSAQINQAMAKAGSQQAIANGQLALSAIDKEKMTLKTQLARTAALGQLATGGMKGAINPEALGADKNRLVQTEGGFRLAQTPKDAEDIKAAQTNHKEIQNKISEARNFIDEKGPSPGVLGIWDTEDSAKADHIREDILLSLRKLYDSKRFNKDEFHMFESMVPSPGAFRQDLARSKLDSLSKAVNEKLNSVYSSKLINYNPGKIKQGEL